MNVLLDAVMASAPERKRGGFFFFDTYIHTLELIGPFRLRQNSFKKHDDILLPMHDLLTSRAFHIATAVVLIAAAVYAIVMFTRDSGPAPVTAAVERGDVTEMVSVSGIVEADDLAKLAFPMTGIVRTVPVEEGDEVGAGDILATLEQRSLLAERQDAVAALQSAQADRTELLAGPREEARTVTDTEIENARQNLERTREEQTEKVASARRTYLSSDLEAVSDDENEDATPPTVSGTYRCDETGEYHIEVYAAGSPSGYAFRFRGLESGTGIASVEQPNSFGDCGLRLQFTDGDRYSNSEWTIQVPNQAASSYTSNLNAYEQAQETASSAIETAENALHLAEQQADLDNAPPRAEALDRADAAITQARARVARIDAQIAERTIVAPFAGQVVDVNVLPGETAGVEPVVTVLADDAFTLTARIPEIDITKVEVGQTARVIFDARDNESLSGTITFISPSATEIDGVAYYEATITLTEQPTWLRSGLNADIDIIVAQQKDVLRIPKRFLISDNDTYQVITQDNLETAATTTVEVGLVGNDGFVEIIGLTEGDTLLAP